MNTADFTKTLEVDQTPEQVFNAINNVRAWWTEDMDGSSRKLNDEFTVRFADKHITKQKLVEVVPNKKIVWLVTGSQLNFLENKKEWLDTTISFEISEKNNRTQLRLTHHGLNEESECYNACSKGWTYYMQQSLLNFITTGKGKPGLPS